MKIKPNVSCLLAIAIFTIMISFLSCQKEGSSVSHADNEQFAQAASESDAESEAIFDDVFDNVMGVNAEVAVGGTGVFAQANHQAGDEIISGANGTDSVPPCLTVT